MPRFNKNKGFSLIEILVACVIIAASAGAFMLSLGQTAKATGTFDDTDIALNAAQSKMEEVGNEDFSTDNIANIISAYNNKYFAVSGLSAPNNWPNPILVTISQINNDLYDVLVKVSWQARGRTYLKQLKRTFALK
ncbi:MAG: type II secretion system GspH family protein [Candidatus Omnitrophica bacterium]|jgi:prepilin-type N-terminal cleavage/methylation domain-containing protein|nr:type II secretion system GspH family protein [Candidatus Omnitrophota bacterium]